MQHNFNEKRGKSEKGAKTIQVLQKDLKLSKAARKSAENSTHFNTDKLKISTGKLQGVNIDYGGSSLNKFRVSIIQHKRGN